MKIFSLDGPFQKYGTIFFDLMVLTLLWVLISAFSFGLLLPFSTAGFLYAINRTMISKDGYMLKSFFAPFKSHFLKNLGINFTIIILLVIASFNIYSITSKIIPYVALFPLYIVLFIKICTVSIISLILMLETELSYKDLLKLGFILSSKHMLWSLLNGLTVATTIILAIIFTPVSLFITAPIAHIIVAKVTYLKILSHYHLDKLEI